MEWEPNWRFAESLPDLDGDGVRDLVIGDPDWKATPNALTRGRVYARSSVTGDVLWEQKGRRTVHDDRLGLQTTTIGDVNGDGFPDVASSVSQGETFVFDGRTGAQLRHVLYRGKRNTAVGDVDGDGLDDFLVGTRMFAGGSFENLYWVNGFYGTGFAVGFGIASTAMDDVDGDGVPDFAIAGPGDRSFFTGERGVVIVFSGATGDRLYHVEAPEDVRYKLIPDFFGESVCAPGDLNGDGIGDLVVGGPLTREEGAFYYVDGPTGEIFAIVDAPSGYFDLGQYAEATGDVNGNGFGDFLVHVKPLRLPQTAYFLVDGGTLEVLFEIDGNTISPHPFAGGFDWNGDGFEDFALAPYPGWRCTLFSSAPAGLTKLGQPCGPTLPRIGATGTPVPGSALRIHLTGVAPGTFGFLVLGDVVAKRLPDPAGSPCALLVQPGDLVRVRADRLRPGEGAATATVGIPDDPAVIGVALHAQWLVETVSNDRTRFATSDVLRFEVQATAPGPFPQLERAVLPPPPGDLRTRTRR